MKKVGNKKIETERGQMVNRVPEIVDVFRRKSESRKLGLRI